MTKGESAHGFTVVAVDMEIFAVFGAVWGIIVDTVWVVCLVDAAGVILVDAVWFIVVDGIWAILVDAACDADVEGGWVLTEKVRGLPVEEEVGTFVMDPTFPPGKNTNQPLLSKSGSLRFSQFSGCWLILSVYIIMSLDFPFVRLFGVR